MNQEEIIRAIEHLLRVSPTSLYRIGKDTGINDNTLRRYTTGDAKVENMSLANGIKLYNYYLEEMEEMENIKQIIEGIETGNVDLENLDPEFHEMNYVDGVDGVWIVHNVEGQEDLEVFFAEHEEVEELRQRIYEGDADESELEELVHNEYADRFNYDDVVAYRVMGGVIQWI